jgi:hypothetical protein
LSAPLGHGASSSSRRKRVHNLPESGVALPRLRRYLLLAATPIAPAESTIFRSVDCEILPNNRTHYQFLSHVLTMLNSADTVGLSSKIFAPCAWRERAIYRSRHHGYHNDGSDGQAPGCPISTLMKRNLPFRMAPIGSPRYPVWLSTVWGALSIVLLCDGHPATAILPLFFWFLHRRWEVSR